MVAVRAIFFAGIAGCASLKHEGFLPVDDLLPLFFGGSRIQLDVLAFGETRDGFAPGAFIPVEF